MHRSRRLGVEHAAKVAVDEPAEGEPGCPRPLGEGDDRRAGELCRRRARGEERVHNPAQGRHPAADAGRNEGALDADHLLRRHRPGEDGAEQGGDERGSGVEDVMGVDTDARDRVERVQADRTTGAERDRLGADRGAEGGVLALGVEEDGVAAKQQLAVHERLDERRLAAADLADDEHVGAGEVAARIQLPWVVAEGPAVEVATDVGSARAERVLGNTGVHNLEVRRRDPVGGVMDRVEDHESPRPSGSVYVNARSCSPSMRRTSRRQLRACCSTSEQAASNASTDAALTVRYPEKR